MTFHGFQDAYLSLAPSYIPLGAALDECLILSVLCVKLTISCLNSGLSTPGKNLQGGMRRVLSLPLPFCPSLFLTALMSDSDLCRDDSAYFHLCSLLNVIFTIGNCRYLFFAIPGAISCNKQTKLGHFHHSLSHIEWNRKEFSWGEFQLWKYFEGKKRVKCENSLNVIPCCIVWVIDRKRRKLKVLKLL